MATTNSESTVEAIGHIISAAQRVVVKRIDLAQAELREGSKHMLLSFLLLLFAAVVLVGGWMGLVWGILSLWTDVSLSTRVLVMGLVHLALGGFAIVAALRFMHLAQYSHREAKDALNPRVSMRSATQEHDVRRSRDFASVNFPERARA